MMKKYSFTRILLCLVVAFTLSQICFRTTLYAQEKKVVGECIKILDNNKDIYHKKNIDVRQMMTEEATLDAIDKGADKKVNSVIEHMQYSNTVEKSFEEVFEDYLSSSLTEINVEWKRTSSYKFIRLDGKKWQCEVEGVVKNVKGTGGGGGGITPNQKENYFITRKSYNVVHINAGKDKGIVEGDKFVAFRHKKKKTISGYNFVPKQAGLITITNSENRFSEGRILRGFFGVKESQQAVKYNFKKYRSGLEYQLASSYEQVNTLGVGDTIATINSKTHTLYYYHYSYISRVGFKLGLEVFDINKDVTGVQSGVSTADTSGSAFAFLPKFNLNYSIGLVPDFLYLVPNFSLGYLFIENGKEGMFEEADKSWGANVVFEGDVSAHIRLGSFDFVGGITYKYINDFPEVTNYYPHIGLCYNFVRYAQKSLSGE